GPVLMPAASCDHPIETPVRRTPLKTGTTTATDAEILVESVEKWDRPGLLSAATACEQIARAEGLLDTVEEA
ncbi:hypothetical protein AB0C11_43035, partial [Streptomyces sp. NPDC039016]|uniref:hypothetical protein n=1 Tax=Streptomyces sp. NPDC039016 TaxID=3154330 RepID=UPI003401040C